MRRRPPPKPQPAAALRRRALTGALLGATLAGLRAARAQTPAPAARTDTLRVGLVPYLSTRAMVDLYEPLRRHLETELQRPVALFTANDFRGLVERARNNDYPLALMPPHLARIAVQDWGHALVARTNFESEVQLIARRDTALRVPDGLRGRRIAAIDALSLTSMVALRWLVQQGLTPGRDVEIEYVRSMSSAVLAVRGGDAIALAGAVGQLRDVTTGDTADLVRVTSMARIPTPVFVAHRTVTPAEVARWRDALLKHVPVASVDRSLAGARYVAIEPRELDAVDSFAQEARRMLGLPSDTPAPRSG